MKRFDYSGVGRKFLGSYNDERKLKGITVHTRVQPHCCAQLPPCSSSFAGAGAEASDAAGAPSSMRAIESERPPRAMLDRPGGLPPPVLLLWSLDESRALADESRDDSRSRYESR